MENMSAWVRRLGWRVCIAIRIGERRRSPRVDGDKRIVNGPKDMGENNSGVEQTQTKPETEEGRQCTVERIGVVSMPKE